MTTAAPDLKTPTYGATVRLPEMTTEDKKRLTKNEERQKAFKGELERPLKGDDKNPDFNILDNRCAPVVLKGVSFLFGQALDISVKLDAAADTEDEGDLAPDDDANDALQKELEAALGDMDDFMTLLSKGAMNGAIYGECFLQLMEPDPAAGMQYPRIIVLNPENVWVETDPDDCELVCAFNIQYKVRSSDPGSSDLIKRKRIWRNDSSGKALEVGGDALGDTWTIQCYVQSGNQGSGDRWQLDGDPIQWDYRFPPIVYCQNLPLPNEFWGMADLTDDLIAMNRHINLVQSNIAKLLWFYSAPYIFIDQPELGQLKITPGMATGIGQGVKVTAIHATGDIASARAFAADLRSDMDELSRVPAVALGRLVDLPRGNISGVALELLFQPLLEKTNIKRRLYGRMIRDLCQRILALCGHGDGENQPVEIHWPELMPKDELQTLQALLIKQQLGWSLQTIMIEANGDYKEELLRKQQEAKDEQASYDKGQGAAPKTQQLPPEMQQNMQAMQQAGKGGFPAPDLKQPGGNQPNG